MKFRSGSLDNSWVQLRNTLWMFFFPGYERHDTFESHGALETVTSF